MQTLERYQQQVDACEDRKSLEDTRITLLGKKGEITLQFKELAHLEPEAKKEKAKSLNILKKALESRIRERKSALEEQESKISILAEKVDITLPAREEQTGKIHPVSQVTEEVIAIFHELGFDVKEGPEIEDDFHNFDALNLPPEHPARQDFDTFYLRSPEDSNQEQMLLRTHTSPVQIRTLMREGPPARFIAPGRTYRKDDDKTHSPMFHQVEGMVIDRDTTMSQLRWVLDEFCKAFFEKENLDLRFRVAHFPFTEPSAEVDLRCSWDNGKLVLGEGNDWMEILGSGMVHPNVLRSCNVDPNEWQGFAFGIGIDRLAMLKYGIPDLRDFFRSDSKWLQHYGFQALDIPAPHTGLGDSQKPRDKIQIHPQEPVERDFAFWTPRETPAGDLVKAIQNVPCSMIQSAKIFDLFQENFRKSVALKVTIQPEDKTLTGEEIHRICTQIVQSVTRLPNTELRS